MKHSKDWFLSRAHDNFNYYIDRSGDCWMWVGRSNSKGYGKFRTDAILMDTEFGESTMVHRIAYRLWVGPIPDGLTIGHTCHDEAVQRGECSGGESCRHRLCVNPLHLEPQTMKQQNERKAYTQKTECKNGHVMDERNTYIDPRGARTCRRCRADAVARVRAKKKAVAA